ncbi:MAG: hypothetical protein A2231_05045 [Candidatus Firestonebacteria bacterium RIFOXYA2_FULL_40_8]|nr:MAG: hypothetical protein A2231_05045 [Candidatus Firestonebacteria bacterium RIFOXYA2_FULL_40_8]
MISKYLTLSFVCFITCISAFCNDETVKTESTSLTHFSAGKISIGISELPWSTFNASLRWWDNNKSGSELIFSSGISGPDNISFISYIPSRYTWFERTEIPETNNIFFIKGTGVSAGYCMYSDGVRTISSTLYFPVGIEHFCFKDIPNFSYSIEARFYICGGYSFNVTSPSDDNTIFFRAGVTPQFFIRWYF